MVARVLEKVSRQPRDRFSWMDGGPEGIDIGFILPSTLIPLLPPVLFLAITWSTDVMGIDSAWHSVVVRSLHV